VLLGEKIIGLRKSKGISQELLAENSRISPRTIQRIEKGESTPRPYTIKIIADALQVPVEQLNPVEDSVTYRLIRGEYVKTKHKKVESVAYFRAN